MQNNPSQATEDKFQYRIEIQDDIDLKVLAARGRLTKTEAISLILEEAMRGDLGPLEDEGYQPSSSLIGSELIARFAEFSRARGVPKNAMFIRAVKAYVSKNAQK